MPAVFPRARVRLRAGAVALTVSSSLIVGLVASPAQAAAPAAPLGIAPDLYPQLVAAAMSGSALSITPSKAVSTGKVKRPTLSKPVHPAIRRPISKAGHQQHRVTRHTAAHHTARTQLTFGTRVIREAATFNGTPYEYGAAGPSRFDCSGFTRFIFAKFGISLPHSSSGQYSMVQHIPASQVRVGDLVFFHSGSGHVYHVGIYAGDDEIEAATHTGDYVRLEGMWSVSYYVGRIT